MELLRSMGALLGNGITVGAATAIALTVFLNLTSARPKRLEARLDFADLPKIDEFVQDVAAQMNWSDAATQRLRSAGEEALSSLLQPSNEYAAGDASDKTPRLIVVARPEAGAVELEFVSVLEDEENLGDRLAYLDDEEESTDDREMSFRAATALRLFVQHQKYYGMEHRYGARGALAGIRRVQAIASSSMNSRINSAHCRGCSSWRKCVASGMKS